MLLQRGSVLAAHASGPRCCGFDAFWKSKQPSHGRSHVCRITPGRRPRRTSSRAGPASPCASRDTAGSVTHRRRQDFSSSWALHDSTIRAPTASRRGWTPSLRRDAVLNSPYRPSRPAWQTSRRCGDAALHSLNQGRLRRRRLRRRVGFAVDVPVCAATAGAIDTEHAGCQSPLRIHCSLQLNLEKSVGSRARSTSFTARQIPA